MATQRNKLINDSPLWNEKQRYKVNAIVVYNDIVYQNITGINSNPTLLNDWVKLSINELNLQSTIDNGGYAESTDGIRYIDIDLENGIDVNFENDSDNTGSGFGYFKNGLLSLFSNVFSNTSLYKRLFQIKNLSNSENYITSEIKDLSSAWIRRLKLNFLSTGLKISSRSDGSENGVIITTDNLTADRVVSFQDKDIVVAGLDDVQNQTGWEQINDTTYTIGSPLTILQGVTGKILTGTVTRINTQLPVGVTEFYNATTDKLLGVNNGDAFTLSLRFKAKMNVANGLSDVGINIGGSLNVISQETMVFAKGSGVEQRFDIDLSYFTGTTFIANGGDIEITPINGDIDIYDIVLVLIRTHKGK